MKKIKSKDKDLSYIWNHPDLHPSYLDNSLINTLKEDISVVIATYNRSPQPNTSYNPLSWALFSILNQKKYQVKEIIVVDDGSLDYTKEVVQYYQKKVEGKNTEVRYIKNKENKGLPISLNIGVNHSNSDYIFFMDDDCILGDYSLFGALYSTKLMRKKGNNIALMYIPVYIRTNLPIEIISIKEMGRIDFKNAKTSGNNHAFPEEYLPLSKDMFLDYKLRILKPIKVESMGGVYLIKKDIFKNVKGISTYFNWPNFYGEQTDFSLKLKNLDYELYLTPDPKFACIHLKYGCSGKINFMDVVTSRNNCNFHGLNLEEIVRLSSVQKNNSGCRVNTEDWSYSKIISQYVIFSKWNKTTGLHWKEKSFNEFVNLNLTNFYAPIGKKIEDSKVRKKIWRKAIDDGNNLLKVL